MSKADLITIEFTSDDVEERAPLDKRAGGFRTVPIVKGTVRHVSRRSAEYWTSRGTAKILREEKKAPAPLVNPFAPPGKDNEDSGANTPALPPTKTQIRRAAEEALAAGARQDVAALGAALSAMTAEGWREVLGPEILDDDVAVLGAACEDVSVGRLDVHADELVELLKKVINLTLPPSRRRT